MREAGIEPDIVCGRLNELRQWAEAATWREVMGSWTFGLPEAA